MMNKKGVSAVSGNTSPVVGEKYTYHIAGWYPDTLALERDPSQVTWELFIKRSNGKFGTTHIKKKGIGDFTFGEKALGHTFRLEAYLYKPEGGGLIITPRRDKIPRISKVELFYVDDSRGDTFSFMEKLRARAYTVNLFDEEVVFTLWEDDAKGEGHNKSNAPIATQKTKVDHNGIAATEFLLSKALMQKAMQGETDPQQLEFYITVEYYSHKKHASDNVEINNPFLKDSKPQSKKPSISSVSKAKGSPAEQKPKSKKEERGILENIDDQFRELWDWSESKGTIKKDQRPTIRKPEGRSPVVVSEAKILEKEKQEIKKTIRCYCYLQGIVETPCNGKGNAVTDKHFKSLAKDIGVEAKVFKTVAIVESGGRESFIDIGGKQKAKILYERHYMYRFLKKTKSQMDLDNLKKKYPDLVHNVGTYKDRNAKYGSEKEQFIKLNKAKKIDNDSAIKSCSWGKFQVMGKYYNFLYNSPNELEDAMNMCEVQHFAYFKIYLKDVTGEPMVKAMKDKNWNKIAELYNGPDYAVNKYHIKMKNKYEKL
ncbi:N-acetylmuramidase domain-containing protein [Chryseobacterium nepalense]|uniref:N-acetylmuramidase domain-containing protein n=1 Tax=Chryseobacterium nepalense TaxID=1854498 RepID=UPI002E0BC6CD|nr:hypothetical protein [Chryseobacterium nepalense]